MTLSIVERSLGTAGFACVPSGPGPFPSVLVVHGSEDAANRNTARWIGFFRRHLDGGRFGA